MAITIDPQEREVRVFERLAPLLGDRVLEIGCGDGRLTRRLASLGIRVSAVDPDAKQVRLARASLTRPLARRIEYRVGRAERLPYQAREFDSVVFSWAL
jgi:2-polyprenyl-3-methyl-5-hydroxy-6-metoxy-1,4-benzoquinol methylase